MSSQELPGARESSQELARAPRSSLAEHFRSDPSLDVELPPEILNYSVGDFAYLQDAVLDLDESEPSRAEILSCLRTLQNGRSWGTDAIPCEAMKYGAASDDFVDRLLEFFVEVWRQFKIPDVWRTSSVVTLFKKGLRGEPSNYRGLSITSNIARILPMIALRRLNKITRQWSARPSLGFAATDRHPT